MKKILLIISFLRSSPKSIDEALNLTLEKQGELLIFFVLDVVYADKIVHQLTDEGWIGGKPSEQLYVSLLKEYKIQAEMKIREIEERASELKVSVRSIIRSGSVLNATLDLADAENPDLIVVTRRKRSSLSRMIFGSLVKTLKREAKCRVRIIDEE